MEEQNRGPYQKLTRQQASDAVTSLGWRLVLGELRTEVLTGSLTLGADVAARAASVPGAEGHLRLDVRADRVILALQTAAASGSDPVLTSVRNSPRTSRQPRPVTASEASCLVSL